MIPQLSYPVLQGLSLLFRFYESLGVGPRVPSRQLPGSELNSMGQTPFLVFVYYVCWHASGPGHVQPLMAPLPTLSRAMHLAMLTSLLPFGLLGEPCSCIPVHIQMAAPGHQLDLRVLVPVPSLRSGTSESQVGGPRACLIQAFSFQNALKPRFLRPFLCLWSSCHLHRFNFYTMIAQVERKTLSEGLYSAWRFIIISKA